MTVKSFHPIFAISCLMLAWLSGCVINPFDPTAPGGGAFKYNWGFIALSQEKAIEVTLFFEWHQERIYLANTAVRGDVPNRGNAKVLGSDHSPLRVPEHLIVKWHVDNGPEQTQEISLAGLVNPNIGDFEGTIWLRYYNGKWYASVISRDQAAWQVLHGMTEYPQGIPK